MTERLEQAIAQLKSLPTDKQDAIATLILDLLAKLAADAMTEYRAGKTQELDPETL
jgi:hypothetical protein